MEYQVLDIVMTTANEIINQRRIINGPRDSLRAISLQKYPWAREIWLTMLKNTWFPAEVDLSRDIREFPSLSKPEKQMFSRALAFLSNLDAIQLTNLAENITGYITDPTIQQCLYRQVFEEAVHVDSYSAIVEAVCSDPMEIYDMYRVNPTLKSKNDFVLSKANEIKNHEFSNEQFIYALTANVVLEGIYFYSGFLSFYTLARMGKMLGAANMIKFIQRDELVHLELFTKIFNSLKAEMPHEFTPRVLENCRNIIRQGVELETSWGQHVIEGGVMGLTDKIMENYCKSLGDERAEKLELGQLYGVANPVNWVVGFSKVNRTEENFFEAKVTSYSKRQLSDW